MINRRNLIYHQRICASSAVSHISRDNCRICEKEFNTPEELIFHLRTCGKYYCYKCRIPFLTAESLNYHYKKSSNHSQRSTESSYSCSLCKCICTSRKDLYNHRLNQHGGNDNLEEIPPYIMDDNNEHIRDVYITNRNHILAEDKYGELRNIYNFQTNNLSRGYKEIRGHVTQIYNEQNVTFRINLAFGMILFNSQTGEYRYFIPYYNSRILTYPYMISKRANINSLMNKLASIDMIEKARANRPSTSWTLVFITNIQYNVFLTNFPIGRLTTLPDYIKSNRYLKNVIYNKNTSQPYKDNLCFFRCLSIHNKRNNIHQEANLLVYLNAWMTYNNRKKFPRLPKEFPGVNLDDMYNLERCFNLKIMLYTLNPNGTLSLIFESLSQDTNIMYLNIYQDHLSYVTNFKKFAKKYECPKCSKIFIKLWNLKRHITVSYDRTKYIFSGGFYKAPDTIFDKLESLGIIIDENDKYYSKFIVWDMEALLKKIHITNHQHDKLKWISKHFPISVSIASNIEGFDDPKCIVELSPDKLISEMMKYLKTISSINSNILRNKFSSVFSQLDQIMEQYQDNENLEADSENESLETLHELKNNTYFRNLISNIYKELEKYINQIPVVGFNSGKYDLNLIKPELMSYIALNYKDNDIYTIKKDNKYLSISTPDLKFIDISNYLVAGCSYSKFLKAYGCEIAKGIFPYEWFDHEDKLDVTTLPPPEDFFSSLSNDNPVKNHDDYTSLQKIWNKSNMQTFRDYLIYYNNLDTKPFSQALNNFVQIYKDQHIDIFKDYDTLPGVARKMLYTSSKSNFALFNAQNADLYYTF